MENVQYYGVVTQSLRGDTIRIGRIFNSVRDVDGNITIDTHLPIEDWLV